MDRDLPFFSVIVPTFNRGNQLLTCLQASANLEYPRERFEVIVVNDGGAAPPAEAIASFRSRLHLTLMTEPHAGPAAARNAGAQQAKGEILAFTDDDCVPDPQWLSALARCYVDSHNHAVGGRTINAVITNPYSTASQMLVDYLYEYYNQVSGEVRFLTSNNLALPAGIFRDLGGFDAANFRLVGAEDRELCVRWRQRGYAITYTPEAIVYHNRAMTLPGFWTQHLNYGRGAHRFHQLHARQGQDGPRLEPRRFYTNLLHYPFAQIPARSAGEKSPWRAAWTALMLAGLLCLAQAANAAGFFWQGLARDSV